MPLDPDAISEILPFAAEGSEDLGDLEPLNTYLSHPLRARGHQPGLAQRGVANRAGRQAAHMAAGLAQFIANRFAAGVRDDANLDAVELGLAAAVTSAAGDVVADHAASREHPAASVDAQGMVELATAAETLAGSDVNRAVTPAGLAYVLGNASIGGNAATATKLATARTINGVPFDGSQNISISNFSTLVMTGVTGLRRDVDNSYLVLSGGSAAFAGAAVQLGGPTHATIPSKGKLTSGATTVVEWSTAGMVVTGGITSVGTSVQVDLSAGNSFVSGANGSSPPVHFYGRYAGVQNFQVTGVTGNVVNLNNSYGGLSDPEYKQDIVAATPQKDDVAAIAAAMVKYRLKSDVERYGNGAPVLLGVVSRDVELADGTLVRGMRSISPGLVTVDQVEIELEDGSTAQETRDSVAYSVLCLKAVKALGEVIDELAAVKAELAAAMARLDALETLE